MKNEKKIRCKECAFCVNGNCEKGLANFKAPMHLEHACDFFESRDGIEKEWIEILRSSRWR